MKEGCMFKLLSALMLLTILCSCQKVSAGVDHYILIDLTVDNKKALNAKIDQVIKEYKGLLDSEEKERLLNTTVSIGSINHMGLSGMNEAIRFPKMQGRKSLNLYRSGLKVIRALEAMKRQIREDQTRYTRSLILTQIEDVIKIDGAKRITIISDGMVVNEQMNFEQGEFVSPKSLGVIHGETEIDWRWIGGVGLSSERVNIVKAWWDEALGERENGYFKKVVSGYEKKQKFHLEKNNKPKKIARKVYNPSDEVTKEINQNKRIISSCLNHAYQEKGELYDQIELEIVIQSKKAKDVSVGVGDTYFSDCMKRSIAKLSFPSIDKRFVYKKIIAINN